MGEFNAIAPEPVIWDRKEDKTVKGQSFRYWMRKLAEEVTEVRTSLRENDRENALLELCDCQTVINSWANALGYSRAEINEAQAAVNEKNRARGVLRYSPEN